MNNMTEKPLAGTPVKAARPDWLSGGWLSLIERYSLIWLSLLL
ncbi:branched-chain amino acid ABC transporter permease, partial [Pseudomonas amygdali pv. mori str. 301020]